MTATSGFFLQVYIVNFSELKTDTTAAEVNGYDSRT